MKTFEEIKMLPHDASGVKNPKDYLWSKEGNTGGIYYPFQKIQRVEDTPKHDISQEDEDHFDDLQGREEILDRIDAIDYLYRRGQHYNTNTERMISKWAYEIESLSYRFLSTHFRALEQAEAEAEVKMMKEEAMAYSRQLAEAKNGQGITAHRDRHSYANNTKMKDELYRKAYSEYQQAKKKYWRFEKMMSKCTSLSIKMAPNKTIR